MKKQFHLTAEGRKDLEAELTALIEKRGEIAQEIASARSQGDLTENAEYHEAKEAQGRNEQRIEELEHILQYSEIIKAPKNTTKVQLGSMVQLKNGGKPKQYQVVGTVEADPLKGKISDESPIGLALMGKKVGDEVEIRLHGEANVYKISAIS